MSTIAKLQKLVAIRAVGLTIDKVKGHSGHLLNDGADILAGIGSNVVNHIYDSAEGQRRATGIAEAYLGLYEQGVREI
jgi:ribonuclease HI